MAKHEGLLISPKPRDGVPAFEWSGDLPPNTRSVYVQMLHSDGLWYPKPGLSVSRKKTEWVEKLPRMLQKGPCDFELYRLIPAKVEYDSKTDQTTTEEENDLIMKTKKDQGTKAAKKGATSTNDAPKKEKAPQELVAGRFRPDSDLAKMYLLLSDGKARTIDEIQVVVKANVKKNIGQGKYTSLKEHGEKSKLYTMARVDGKIQMIMAGSPAPKKKEEKPTEQKKETKSEMAPPKTNGHANGASKKKKKTETQAAPPAETKKSGLEISE